MRVRLNYIAPVLAAGTIVAAVAVAPIAAAAPSQGASGAGPAASSASTEPSQSCVTLGGTQNQCQSPGNAQVYDAPPQVDFFPYAGGAT
jgi:hypothetical protein